MPKQMILQAKHAYQLLHDGILALQRAEQVGMRLDMDYAREKEQELTIRINALEKEFTQSKFYRHWQHSIGGGKVNINSNDQLAKYLYGVKKIQPVKLTDTGKGSTDDDALQQLNIPELSILLEIRKWKKARDTYFSQFLREQVNGRIHPSFNLHTVVTYRSSSNNPNFQNIPKRDKEVMQIIRGAIFPRIGHQLMEVDFSGLEVMIAACYHKDPTMLEYITNPANDMHGDVASQIFKIRKFNRKTPEHAHLRSATKNGFVFPQFYGDYYRNNAISLFQWVNLPPGKIKPGTGVKMPDGGYISDHLLSVGFRGYPDFEKHLQDVENDFWNNRFPVYKKWKDQWHANYQKNGHFDSLTGFKFQGLMKRNDAINYPVQGAAFHCLLWCFIEIDKELSRRGLQSRLIGQIHDAVVLDVYPPELKKVCHIVKRITTRALREEWDWIIVPLSVEADLGDVNGSWATLKPFEL